MLCRAPGEERFVSSNIFIAEAMQAHCNVEHVFHVSKIARFCMYRVLLCFIRCPLSYLSKYVSKPEKTVPGKPRKAMYWKELRFKATTACIRDCSRFPHARMSRAVRACQLLYL